MHKLGLSLALSPFLPPAFVHRIGWQHKTNYFTNYCPLDVLVEAEAEGGLRGLGVGRVGGEKMD